MSKKGGFGSAKPLAGQSGYKVSEADLLDKEARDMEIRLRNLQDKMKMQQLEDESIARPGGSRWGSARLDKGSIGNYAKDVKEKALKQSAKSRTKVNLLTGEIIRAPAAAGTTINNDPSKYASSSNNNSSGAFGSPPRQQNDAGGDDVDAPSFQASVPMEWSVEDVGEWLCMMNLAQYVESFASNEMTGAVLLDISLEDLDYLGVTKLAHRKTLVKAVEELRLNFSSPDMGPEELAATYAGIYKKHGGMSSPQQALMSRSMGGLPKAPPQQRQKLQADAPDNYQHHWSHLEPLSSNPAKNEPMAPNGADDEGVAGYAGDVLDEEAEKAAFTEAVMAWRNAGKVTVSSTQGSQAQAPAQAATATAVGTAGAGASSLAMTDSPTKTGGEEWVNPWDAPQSDFDDNNDLFGPEKEKAKKHTQIVRPTKRAEKADSSTVTLGGAIIVAQGGSTSIVREAMSDEAERKEREEFQRAVMEWRGAGKADAKVDGSSAVRRREGASSAEGSGGDPDMVKGSLLDQKQRNLELTEKLKRDMDAKYEENSRQLELQKCLAREQMERASRELEEARRQRLTSSSGAKQQEQSFGGMDDDCESQEGESQWRGEEDDEILSGTPAASPASRSVGASPPGYSGSKQSYGGRRAVGYGTSSGTLSPADAKGGPVTAVEVAAAPKPELELLSSVSLADAKEEAPVQYDVEEPSDDDEEE